MKRLLLGSGGLRTPERLEAWIRKEQFQLIETLAERACDLICKEWPQVKRCQVTIKKPSALPKARYAAVTAERKVAS